MGADKRPEELINYYAKTRAGVRKIASATGFFALLWSTVVLLGGFVVLLAINEFWFISALSLIMASNGLIIIKFFASIAVAVKKILITCTVAILVVSPFAALVISASRLLLRDYGDADGDAAQKVKLSAASLIIFYVLVILQSLSYTMKFLVCWPWMLVCKQLGFEIWGPKIVKRYRRQTRHKFHKNGVLPKNWNLITFSVGLLESASWDDRLWGARVLDTLIGKDTHIRQEILYSSQAIQNLIDMVCLTKPDSREIRERGARIVADLASELRITQFPDALRGICCLLESSKQYSDTEVAHSSENSEQSLDENSHKVSTETFEHTHHQDDAHLSLVITEQSDHKQDNLPSGESPTRRSWIQTISRLRRLTPKRMHEWDIYLGAKYNYSYVPEGTKELIFQGLVILERLTQDEDNCIEIARHQRLLSKITLPLSHQSFLINGCDHTWVDMLRRSLTLVSRLVSVGPGDDDATRLRRDMSRNALVIRNLMRILEVDTEGARELHGETIEILTELALDDPFTNLVFDESTSMAEMFVKRLRRIFLDDNYGNVILAEQEQKDNKVRRKAGEALAILLSVPNARDNSDASTSATNVNAVDLLPKQDVISLLTKVVDQILSENAADVAMRAGASNSCHVESQPPNDADTRQSPTQQNEGKLQDRKLLAAMLSLAAAICNRNVISGDDFTRAIPNDAALGKKLKEIVETNMDATTDNWRTLKLVCQMVIAMCQIKPTCIRMFNGHSLKEALSKALEIMSDVDNCMLFAGNDREVPARSLASIVEEAHELLTEELGDISG